MTHCTPPVPAPSTPTAPEQPQTRVARLWLRTKKGDILNYALRVTRRPSFQRRRPRTRLVAFGQQDHNPIHFAAQWRGDYCPPAGMVSRSTRSGLWATNHTGLRPRIASSSTPRRRSAWG